MVNEHEPWRPMLSTAEQLTRVSPSGKSLPEAGEQDTEFGAPAVTVGAGYVTGRLSDVTSLTVIAAGQASWGPGVGIGAGLPGLLQPASSVISTSTVDEARVLNSGHSLARRRTRADGRR